jgi:hypothetical protein
MTAMSMPALEHKASASRRYATQRRYDRPAAGASFRHEHADTFICRSPDDLAARLVWARERGYRTAKARRASGYVDRPLLPSEQLRLIEQATRIALGR